MEEKNNAISNFIWKFLERFGAQGVTIIVSIVLARLLDPHVYGTISLITVFTNILSVFIDGGMGSALIQKKEVDDLDYASVFCLNVVSSIICYIGMFIVAPMVAGFYRNNELIPLIRVLSLIIIISSIKNIQQAYVARNMLFKKFFFATLSGTIIAAVTGVSLAALGYGAWALVAQYLVNASVDTAVLWITVDWKPRRMFSISRLKSLFSFGWKLMVSGIIYAFYNNLRELVIGKKYTTVDLAYYDKAYMFPRYIVLLTNNSVDSVLFPIMSRNQDDVSKLRNLTKQTIQLSTYIMFPLMVGLFICSDSIITIVLSEKWLPSSQYLKVFCVVCAMWSFDTANQNLLKAMGKSSILLAIEIVETVISVVLLLISMNYGVFAIAIAWAIGMLMNQIIVSIPNKHIVGYGYIAQVIDVIPNFILSTIMAAVVFGVSYINMDPGILLVLQVTTGLVVYLTLSVVSKNEAFRTFYGYLVSSKKARNK